MKTVEFRKKLNEVFLVEPNDMGPGFLNNVYKLITGQLKNMPFLVVVPLAFAVSLVFYFLFGYLAVRLVSLLQYGF